MKRALLAGVGLIILLIIISTVKQAREEAAWERHQAQMKADAERRAQEQEEFLLKLRTDQAERDKLNALQGIHEELEKMNRPSLKIGP